MFHMHRKTVNSDMEASEFVFLCISFFQAQHHLNNVTVLLEGDG